MSGMQRVPCCGYMENVRFRHDPCDDSDSFVAGSGKSIMMYVISHYIQTIEVIHGLPQVVNHSRNRLDVQGGISTDGVLLF